MPELESPADSASTSATNVGVGPDGSRTLNNFDAQQDGQPDEHFETITVIERRPNWRLFDKDDFTQYRDLLRFMVWREIRVRYAQSAIGVGWAVIQPIFTMVVFTIVFGGLAKVSSDGVPYALFSLAGLVPWTYFSSSLSEGTNILVGQANMLKKVYFPRIFLPLSAVFARMVDFSIAMVLLGIMMIVYGAQPNWGVVMLPVLIVLMVLSSYGLACWLSAFAIQYRDVKHAMNFLVQSAMYASPVIYPVSDIPEKYHLIYALNPMVGVIEGFRSALLSTRPMPWELVGVGAFSAIALALTGTLYFNRKERIFADVA